MERIGIERSIWINASPEKVWNAITDPVQIEHWFSPGTEWRGTGTHVGGRIYVYDPETGGEMYTQVIELVDPPRQLVTRSDPQPPEQPYFTTWKLEDENGGTRLTMIFTGYEQLPDSERQPRFEQDSMGFELMMGNIKAMIEGTPLPNPMGF
jgi:uncharacterized protein YndB with AHSA1/START domain